VHSDWEIVKPLVTPYADLAYQCMQLKINLQIWVIVPGLGGVYREEFRYRPTGKKEYVALYCSAMSVCVFLKK